MCVAALCTSVPVVVYWGERDYPGEERSSSEVTQQAGNQVYTGMTEAMLLLTTYVNVM